MASTSKSSSNPKEGKGSARVFGKFDIQELRNIRIAIRRPNIPDSGNSGPLQRSLDDPFNLIVHKIGEGLKPLFAREDVIVNAVECVEERIIVKSADKSLKRDDVSSTSRSKESSDKDRSSYVHNPSSRHEDRSRDLSPYHLKDRRGSYRSSSPNKYSNSRERDREKSPSRKSDYPSTSKHYETNRNVSPKDADRYKFYRDEKLRKEIDRRRAQSPASFLRKTPPHSKYYDRNKSPSRLPEGYRGLSKSYSVYRDRSPSDTKYKRRSRSPPRVDEYRKRHSTSPRREGHKNYSRHSRSPRSYSDHRSRSPEDYRKYKHDKRERRSRSSSRERYKREDRRSRSPYRHALTRQPHPAREISYVGPILPYYGAEPYWLPQPQPGQRYRPPFPPIPPDIYGPPPYVVLPRAMFPPPQRQRLPIYNNRTIKPLPVTTTQDSTTNIATTTTTVSKISAPALVMQADEKSAVDSTIENKDSTVEHSSSLEENKKT